MKIKHKVELVGDGLENPVNALAMLDAARMFESSCVFRDRMNLAASWSADQGYGQSIPSIDEDYLEKSYQPLIALDNLKNAQPVFGFQLPANARAGLVAGNERLGISTKVSSSADHALLIPMVSKKVNCINVAAACAVSLYYLSFGLKGKMQIRKDPGSRRPELLVVGGQDHVELGSSIRSAAAFGWTRMFLEDEQCAWFGSNRSQIAESRGAARRSKNSIRVVPTTPDHRFLFREAVVITRGDCGEPLHQLDLARGDQQVIILCDEEKMQANERSWSNVAESIIYGRIHATESESYKYHFRHFSSIAMAEITRQVGQKALWTPSRQQQTYHSALKLLVEEKGEEYLLEELFDY